MPEPVHGGPTGPAPIPRHPHKTSPLSRFLMVAIFLIASGALVFGILALLNSDTEESAPDLQPPFRLDTGRHPPTAPELPQHATQPQPRLDPIGALPTPKPDQASLIQPVPPLPDGIEPTSPGMEAHAILETFLTAKSLEERLPLLETKTPPEELAASCLAGPLPRVREMAISSQESNPLESVVDFYYHVDFEAADGNRIPHTLLVRTRGSGEPKVVVDPFLDLYGGRLSAYAASPSEKGGVFQVVAYAVASCLDPDIPNREKKLTLKLLPRENTREIAQAYFSRLSKIGEMLEDGTYALSYGKAKACTVMLRWNTEDNPDHPYLEAIAIKAQDWNP